jgi:type IV pilus assembly protein PilC
MSFIVTPSQLKRRAELYHQLGSMITAGVPLLKSLEMVISNPAIRVSRKTILGLIQCLQSGLTFTQSMMRVQGWMPDFDIALLSAGEKTGRLDSSFKLLSVYYTTRAQIIRDTISGLATTLITLHVFLLIFPLGFLVAFAQGIFKGDYTLCLPFILEKVLVFGTLYGVVLFLIFACQGRRGERWRSMVESIANFIPFLRMARKYLALSRLAAALEALVSAGVSIVTGWELAAAACGSPSLARQISTWKTHLENGSTPSEMVNQTRYFPEMFANLYATGENSGQLDETLGRLHVYYQEEGFSTLRIFTRIMNGVIYAALVGMVAFNIFRFYLNYFAALNSI